MTQIPLSEEQKSRLEDLSQSDSVLLMHRARLILAYAEGKPTMQAALQAGISRGRARYWKRQFIARGMSIFDANDEELFTQDDNADQAAGVDSELIAVVDAAHDEIIHAAVVDEIPFPAVQKSIGITADDSMATAGKKVWLYHFAIMLSHEQGTLEGKDVEELHDMRVATRRMRTAFDIFGDAFDEKIMRRYLKGLRRIGQALGQVRDMDVILENGLDYQKKLRENQQLAIKPLFESWNVDIDSKRIKLTKHLKSEAYRQFKSGFNQFVQMQVAGDEVHRPGIETISHVRDIVPVLIYNRYAKLRAYDSCVPTATITQLHALRIEFKKFRYTLEYFKEVLGDSASDLIGEIRKYQDHLGELHDADVACQLVRSFLKNLEESQAEIAIPERVNPGPIVTYLAYLHAERYRLTVAFPDQWNKFNRPEIRQKMARAISTL